MFKNEKLDGVFLMPKDVLKYVNNAKKSELKLIMYVFAKGAAFDVKTASEELCETPENINLALSFWRGAGLLTESGGESVEAAVQKKELADSKAAEQKSYTTVDVANARLNDNDFKQVVEFAEGTLGELLNASKQAELFYLYDNLGMECDVIMGIIAHCASLGKTKLNYIKKTAEGIHNDGVRTYKELEAYFAAKEAYTKYESAVKRVIGAGERALTKSEKVLVEKWEKDLKIPEELLEAAYERTISLISKPSLPYMSKILENWHSEGIKTAQEARELVDKNAQKSKKETQDERAAKAKQMGFDIEFEDIYEKP